MATLRDIRRRITSVKNTRQITSAMRMVSAAKLNRAQLAVRRAQPYADHLMAAVRNLSYGLTGEDHPFFTVAENGKTLVLLFTSDRGLCGGFNSNLNKFLLRHLADEARFPRAELIVIGRVGNDYFKRRGVSIGEAVVQARDVEKAQKIRAVCGDMPERFLTGEVGRVYLAYNRFVNPMRQDPTLVQLLPTTAPPERRGSAYESRETLFEPSRAQVLREMLPRYLENQLFQALLNTDAGEHGARMVAMEGATKNAGKMIDSLTLQYNRARQAGITKELIEIVNGAQSL
jgi:F-type H+-transporting ATPase subunit gamma